MDINLIDNKEEKIELAKKVLGFVKDGQTIGFGSGSTSYLTGIEIGKLVKEKGIKITACLHLHICLNYAKNME